MSCNYFVTVIVDMVCVLILIHRSLIGFEESRPALLLGIIVRDKRKRPVFESLPVVTKKTKVEVSVVPPVPVVVPTLPTRSYTPPPAVDPRIKPVVPPTPPTAASEDTESSKPEDDMSKCGLKLILFEQNVLLVN